MYSNQTSVNHLDIKHKTYSFPKFQRPVIIGFFGVDQFRKYSPGSKNLKYLYRPDHNETFNLNIGYKDYIPKADSLENEEKLDHILLWLTHSKYLHNVIDVKVNYLLKIIYEIL